MSSCRIGARCRACPLPGGKPAGRVAALSLTRRLPSTRPALAQVDILGLKSLAPGKPLTMTVTKATGAKFSVTLNQTMNSEQIDWFKAGSALNAMKAKLAGGA